MVSCVAFGICETWPTWDLELLEPVRYLGLGALASWALWDLRLEALGTCGTSDLELVGSVTCVKLVNFQYSYIFYSSIFSQTSVPVRNYFMYL